MAVTENPITVGPYRCGTGCPLLLIAGPCVLEHESLALEIARQLQAAVANLPVNLIFKASFDKANRTSITGGRGPGLDRGLDILRTVQRETGLPVTTDIHEAHQAAPVATVCDLIQIPAFLARQTDLLVAAAGTGRAVNVKKGQFLAPLDVRHAIAKVVDSGNERVFVTERGTSFGYHNLVVDMRAFPLLRGLGRPVVFDVTHSLQLPGAGDGVTAGQAEFITPLASAGVAAGVDGVFLEVHEAPARAKSDAHNALALDLLEPLLSRLVRVNAAVAAAAVPPAGAR